jgi:hypothetical protein
MTTYESLGRVAFDAYKREQGQIGDWAMLTVQTRLAWCAAAEAVIATQCFFDLEGQKAASSHALKNALKK